MDSIMNITSSVYDDIEKVKSNEFRYSIFQHEDEILVEEMEVRDNLVSSFCGEPEATLQQFLAMLKKVRTKAMVNYILYLHNVTIV